MMHSSKEGRTGWRGWWHFGERDCLRLEVYWWSHFCHAYIDIDDDGWGCSLAIPPFAVFLNLDIRALWKPTRKAIHYEDLWLTDERECKVSIHDWKIWVTPWGRKMEWHTRDPWWVRGFTIEPAKLLGQQVADSRIVGRQDVIVPMPEGTYKATATTEEWIRGRRFWFKRRSSSVWLEIPKGIPHAGKGENSWDCGDDGLFGIGGDTVEDAIGRAVASVLRDRRRYGHASPEAVQKALS
jgi:hypothetical protein